MKRPQTNRRTVVFRPNFYYETVKDYCFHVGISPQNAADLTGLSLATIKRWLKNDNAPRWFLPFLHACNGHILAKGFEGWQCRDKQVISDNMRFAIGYRTIEEYTFTLDLLHQLQRDNSAMRQILEKRKGKTGKVLHLIKKNA